MEFCDAPAPVDDEHQVGQRRNQRGKLHFTLAQLALGQLLQRDVFLDRDKARNRPVIRPDRGDRGRLPVMRTVLANVLEFAAPHVAVSDRRPHCRVFVRRTIARLEDAGVLSRHFLRGVAGAAFELRIDVLDVSVAIGDHDRGRAAFDRGRQLAQLLFADVCHRLGAIQLRLARPHFGAAHRHQSLQIGPVCAQLHHLVCQPAEQQAEQQRHGGVQRQHQVVAQAGPRFDARQPGAEPVIEAQHEDAGNHPGDEENDDPDHERTALPNVLRPVRHDHSGPGPGGASDTKSSLTPAHSLN